MRNFKGLFIVILLCLIILISILAAMQVRRTDSPQVIVNTSLDIAQSDIERVKKEAERAVNSICPILGVQKKIIRIKLNSILFNFDF